MSEVFLSYRQTDDAQRERVRAIGERLRDAGVTVVLDQFYLDNNPAGPDETWAKWSSDRALQTEFVLVIGTPEWFQCFEKTQPPGTGLGAACEADDLRTRIYEAGGVVKNIRVVLFDDADRTHMPGKLRGYHSFHAERDFESIVRWLGGKILIDEVPRTSIPHNLPSLQPFFGREDELKKIADALDPESRTWGALIDGPGGMGKTSLAVRAAYDASSDDFEKIVFVSLKSRELDDDGVRDLSSFLISGLSELLNELARELGHAEIAKVTADRRPQLLLDSLRGTRTLLVLDNLESLVKKDRDTVFTFVKKLPVGCKAILTSRQRIGSAAEELILEKFSESAALDTLAKLANSNPALARENEAQRLALYHETGGNPLLLRWTAGQIGRGSCLTVADAISYLHSCPDGNDALEFVFGDLVENFTETETRILCALTYFTLPAKLQHLAQLAESSEADVDHALRGLANRSLVVPTEELKSFTLVSLVSDFLRKKKPGVITETGDRLEEGTFALAVENGFRQHDRFPVLDVAWPTIAAAMPRFLTGPNDRLQTMCSALHEFLYFTGRWDEWLAFSQDAEQRALSVKDFYNAGLRAYHAGWVHYLRNQSTEVLACADRAESSWREAEASDRDLAFALRLRGIGYKLANNYSSAVEAFTETVELWRTVNEEGEDVTLGLNDLADAEYQSNDLDSAERHYREALRIAKKIDYREGIANYTSNLALLMQARENWQSAESLAREALSFSEEIGRLDLIAFNCHFIARALLEQGKKADARPYALRSEEIFTRLGVRGEIDAIREILIACEQ